MPFSKTELNRARPKCEISAPGKDKMCLVMIKHHNESSKDILLVLNITVWEEGKLPEFWKEAIITRKPEKDDTKQESINI